LLRTILFRILLLIAWIAGFAMASIAFIFSQAVASGGWLETTAAHLGPRFEAVASALGGLILLYPDICIHGLFTTLFWLQSFVGLGLSLLALTLIVPRLITRDRSSNALTIYLSRPLTSADYLLGKLGMIAGVIVLVWTGPLLSGWLLSALLAPNRDFIVYSFSPLLRALAFNGIALTVLASIALGVSALGVASTASASVAITAIDAAIATVSTTRASLGAFQNRFQSVINGLQVSVENLSASESRIRDTDMASEMVNFTKQQILMQAGTAMLAQANQIPQTVLKLLQ